MLGACAGVRPFTGPVCHAVRCTGPWAAKQPLATRRKSLVAGAGPELVKVLHAGAGLGILAGIAASSLPILSGESRRLNERRYLQPTEEEVAESIRWGVMSIISFIPYLSPLAWVFGALDDEQNASLYFTYAALYTTPYLTSGFRLDSFALLALAAGVAHVQIERMAQTEPVELAAPEGLARTLREASRGIQTCVRACARFVHERRLHRASDGAGHAPLQARPGGGSGDDGHEHANVAEDADSAAQNDPPMPCDEEQEEASSSRDRW